MDTKSSKKMMSNGWKIDFLRPELAASASEEIYFGCMNGASEDREEWNAYGEFTLFVGPKLDGDWCDQHIPDLDEKLESIIGDLGTVGTMECAHDIERNKVEAVLGRSGVSFDDAMSLVRDRLIKAGIAEGEDIGDSDDEDGYCDDEEE